MSSSAAENGRSESSPLLGNPLGGHTADGDAEEGRFRRGYKSLTSRWTALCIQRVVIVILIIAVVLLATLYPRHHKKEAAAAGLCLTQACIHAADGYLTNLSPNYKNIDPCEDFEEFVCGGWRGAHDMRADQGMTDALGLINDGVTSTIRNILEGDYPDSSDHSTFSPSNLGATVSSTDRNNFDELKAAYDACMDVDTITKEGIQPIVALIDELAKTFDSSSASPVDYSDSVLFLKKRGISSFFSFYVSDDDKDPETQIIGVSPIRSFGLPSKDYFEDKDVVSQYLSAMTKVLGAIKPSVAKIGAADKAAKALVEFESRLSLAAPDKEDMDDVTVSEHRSAFAFNRKGNLLTHIENLQPHVGQGHFQAGAPIWL